MYDLDSVDGAEMLHAVMITAEATAGATVAVCVEIDEVLYYKR